MDASYGAVQLVWCDRCMSTSLARVAIYLFGTDGPHPAGHMDIRCLNCGPPE